MLHLLFTFDPVGQAGSIPSSVGTCNESRTYLQPSTAVVLGLLSSMVRFWPPGTRAPVGITRASVPFVFDAGCSPE